MSSIVRVYNIFTQIKNNLDGENDILGQALLKNVFNVKNDDDLNYLKPYIFQEIDNCESEMRAENLGDDEISRVIPPFQKYMQNELFNPLAVFGKGVNYPSLINENRIAALSCTFIKTQFPVRSMEDITRDAKQLQKSFGKYSDKANNTNEAKSYEAQIEKIKGEVASLKNEFLQLNKADDYVYSFILLNLDRIDILLNNFDKIAPKYIEFNLYAIITPVFTIEEYEKFKDSLKSLWDSIIYLTNTYGGCATTVYTLADITQKLLK